MKPIFHHKPVNGPFEDPAVYVRILREREGMLFDAGDISRLSVRELLKISNVFVTHSHMDHFIGFDTILRSLLRRDLPVTFYGPEGIIDSISGKFQGYTWNLISEYPLIVNVVEIRRDTFETACFRAFEGFRRVNEGLYGLSENLVDNDLFSVRAIHLEHDIPTLGFFIKEKIHINIDKDVLSRRGLEIGPWLAALKKAVRNQRYSEVLDTGSGMYRVSDLSDVYTITDGQKVSYIMDTSPTEKNMETVIDFVNDSDSLYIESYFMHKDIDQARRRDHLTAKLSGMIARKAGVKNLHLLHFSPRYRENPEALLREAFEEFRR